MTMFAKSMNFAKDDIRRAFADGEFAIVLQPQIEVADGSAVAAEAFVRWNHPSFGTLTPQLFLPFIDSHGETPRLFDAVVRQSLAAAAELHAVGRNWRVSVNLGAADLETGVAPDIVAAALRESQTPAWCLVLEAPESAMAGGDPIVSTALERLRSLGCGVALDSGGSLPLDTVDMPAELFTEIKIGGAAIMRFAEIARKVDGGRIARRLAFARQHGLRSVAVGVEQEKTLTALVKLGFGAVQGALVAKPAPLDQLLTWDGSWSGEPNETAPVEAPARPRPRLIQLPAAAPFVAPPPIASTPKLVETLRPMTSGFSFSEDEDDALDVGFDDDLYAPSSEEDASMEEIDPSEDMIADGEELEALERTAPLHAGMIERPVKQMRDRVVKAFNIVEEQVPDVRPEQTQPEPFNRVLALRVKAPPPPKSFWSRIGLGRLLKR
jgi:EAL domain-containing protein (putative c-di-GMP-specific phosphodiesterase class I)